VWIITAWQHIPPEVTVKGLKRCCAPSVVDGTDEMLWNGIKEDGKVGIQCKEDEGTRCQDGRL